MDHAADLPTQPGELHDHVPVAVAGVDDDRQAQLVGEHEVPREVVLLDRKRGSIPVTIEPSLAERHDLGGLDRQITNRRPVVGAGFSRVVGMNPDRSRDHRGVVAGDHYDRLAVGGGSTHRNDLADPARPRQVEHGGQPRQEARVGQVGMGVGQSRD